MGFRKGTGRLDDSEIFKPDYVLNIIVAEVEVAVEELIEIRDAKNSSGESRFA